MGRVKGAQMEGNYPEFPGSKGPGTSRAAAESVAGQATALRDRVLVIYSARPEGGLTADEVASILKIDKGTVRPRVSELVKMGELERTGRRRPNASGRQATVWKIKPEDGR